MIVDNKGRLFGKLNLLDLLFFLILVAVIAVAIVMFSGGKSLSNSTIPVTYTVEVQNREAAFFDHLVEGEQVINGVTKARMGKIVSFTKEPAKVLTQAGDKFVLAMPENGYDGYIQITADATVAYPDMLLDGEALKIGKSVALRSESLAIQGYIVAIDYDSEQLKGAK